MIQKFQIINKKEIAPDIFEITYSPEKEISIKPGQFITFLIDKIGWRAYSILDIIDWNIVLIIKKWEIEKWGRWGSKYLCEMKIWEELKWVGPAWHFVLQENNLNKLFIATGTGFVPIYNQILWNIRNKIENKIKLIFWVRNEKDLFYLDELNKLKKENSNFDFEIFLSSEETEKYSHWYVTNFLTPENLKDFEEFYICWAPAMIDSVTDILEKNNKENIYFEKY